MTTVQLNSGDYFVADDRWEMFGVTSRDQYVGQFVLPGKYHKLVPETVQKAHRTAEYLMAHAWYYWPMYDESLKKMTLIFEIAIKQKAKQLGIDLKQSTKNGKAREKSLNTLIQEIHRREPKRQILDSLLRSKNLRNTFAHPTQDSWMGGIQASQDNVKYYVNIINTLFLDYALFEEYLDQLERIENLQQSIDSDLYRITMGRKKLLVHRVLSREVYPSEQNPFLLLALEMVISDSYEVFSKGYTPDPIIIGFKDVELTDVRIRGIDFEKGEDVIIELTDHPQNTNIYKSYLDDLDRLGNVKFKQMNDHAIRHTADWGIERMKYQYLWEQYGHPKTGESR